MKYIRTEDKIITDSIATHKLTEDICDAGYLKTLKKGANVRISKEWFNYYGRWVDIIDEDGLHYSIRPNEVEKVVKELHQANKLEDLCDEIVLHYLDVNSKSNIPYATYERNGIWEKERESVIKEVMNHPSYRKPLLYGAIWTEWGLKYVAKMNDKGEWELL